jgi:menaquinone-9 beta-reductase
VLAQDRESVVGLGSDRSRRSYEAAAGRRLIGTDGGDGAGILFGAFTTAMVKSTDVFIVGGGPAGLAAAIAARQRGLEVVVADGTQPPIDKPCGEGLMPDGREALEKLGIVIPEEVSRPFRGIRFVSGNRSVEANFPSGTGTGMRRTALHEIMVSRAEAVGVKLLWQTPVKGLSSDGVVAGSELVRARWIVGADGGHSLVRRWAGLDQLSSNSVRFAFRRHYRITPWTDCMELHWGPRCQLYITPIAADEICVALISRDPHLRLDQALKFFPAVQSRLRDVENSSPERGAVSATRKLRRVVTDQIALIGDASGAVDAITGEGLCLAFKQAQALADSLEAGNLDGYQQEHRKLARQPAAMAPLMLSLDWTTRFRQRVMRAFESEPRLFERMLAMHVGALSLAAFAGDGVDLVLRTLLS